MQPLFLPYALGEILSPPTAWRSYIFIPLSDIFRKSVPKLPPIPLLFLLLEMAIFGPLPTQTRRSKENMSLYPRISTHIQSAAAVLAPRRYSA